jgi:lipopolysaccharide transport system permease protein
VKRVPFPLEILPVASVASATAHGLFSLLVLAVVLAVLGHLHWSALLAVVVAIPLAILCLAASWFLAAAGVFVRDLGHAVGLTVTALLFLSPVLYPLSALPDALRPWYWLNPLTFIVEDMRAVLLAGQPPAWGRLAAGAGATLVLALLAWLVFARGRRSFADAV